VKGFEWFEHPPSSRLRGRGHYGAAKARPSPPRRRRNAPSIFELSSGGICSSVFAKPKPAPACPAHEPTFGARTAESARTHGRNSRTRLSALLDRGSRSQSVRDGERRLPMNRSADLLIGRCLWPGISLLQRAAPSRCQTSANHRPIRRSALQWAGSKPQGAIKVRAGLQLGRGNR
jgi:hypothetical protein